MGAIALVLFPDPLGIGPDDVGRHIELEVRVARLLKESADREIGSAPDS